MKQALTLILGLILNNSLMAQGFPDSTTILMETKLSIARDYREAAKTRSD